MSANVLRSIKGPNGGYRLARAASDISVLEILEAVDGPIKGQVTFSEEKNGVFNEKLDTLPRRRRTDAQASAKGSPVGFGVYAEEVSQNAACGLAKPQAASSLFTSARPAITLVA